MLADAFRQDYDRNSASILRIAQTALLGLANLEGPAGTDPWLAIRRGQIRTYAQQIRLLLPTLACFAHNALEQKRVAELSEAFRMILGPLPLATRVLSGCALAVAGVQTIRTAFFGDVTQPSVRLTRYRWPARAWGWPAPNALDSLKC